jgi:hypothetical protein
MLQAIILLKKATVQYGTARKIRATLTRLWECSPEGGSDIVMSAASRKGCFIATRSPLESRWYGQFTLGVSARMGDIVSQDRAYTFQIIHALLQTYEEEWNNPEKEMPLKKLCSCMFLLVSSLGGMRGFEVMWTDLAALRYDLEYCEDIGNTSAVSWPIMGHFKAHNGLLCCYMIPIAGKTNLGIKFFEWTQRFVGQLASMGRVDGWAFQRPDGTRVKAAEYMDDIYRHLEDVQAATSLIDPLCDVCADFGAQRSGRPHIIELQYRWQTDRAKGERSVNRSMIHLYSEVRNMKTTLIQPSLVC